MKPSAHFSNYCAPTCYIASGLLASTGRTIGALLFWALLWSGFLAPSAWSQSSATAARVHQGVHQPGPSALANRNRNIWLRRSASSSTTLPQAAPFFGNLSSVSVPNGQALALQRQSDCSLTLVDFMYTLSPPSLTAMFDSQVGHYEKVIHNNAFLETAPDLFPGGCVDPTAGISARPFVYLGVASNGQTLMAGEFSSGVLLVAEKSDYSLGPVTTLATPQPPLALVSADLNKDGEPDLVSVNSDGLNATITVLLNNGDGTFQTGVNLALPNEAAQYAVVDDLNNDGIPDILACTGSSFTIFLGKGDGTFQAPKTVTPAGSSIFFLDAFVTADVNGDGFKDIITASGEIYFGAADGVTFTLSPNRAFTVNYEANNDFTPAIIQADFNKDGKVDLATNDAVTIRTYLGNGDGTFQPARAYAAVGNHGFLVATDIDGDGNLDLWSGYGGQGVFSGDGFTPNLSYALMGNGDGTFQGAPVAPVQYDVTNFADLNGDGRPDLVGLTLDNLGNVSLTTYLTNGAGIPSAGPALPLTTATGGIPVLGKFAGDNIDAFMIGANGNGPTFNLAVGNGDGTFQLPTPVPVPSFVTAPGDIDVDLDILGVQAVDLNHDGKMDLIYSFYDVGAETNTYFEGFAVQLGNGDGTFQAPKITYTYNSTTMIFDPHQTLIAAVQDVNKDNFPDVFLILPTGIANGTEQNEVQLFLSNGDGTFKTPSTLTLLGNYRTFTNDYFDNFTFGDLNGDGNIDLVVSGSSSDATVPTFGIALGNGDGTFKPATTFTTEGFGYPGSPTLADLDGDGKLDLALPGAMQGSGGFFPGNGDGTFQSISNGDGTISPPQSVVLSGQGGTVAADFNQDGKTDLIFGSLILLSKEGATPPAQAATITVLAASPNPSTAGATVTFTANVTSSTAGTITGTVTFLDGETNIGSGNVGADGGAMFMTSALAQGSHSITAMYGGNSNYSTSTSTAVTQLVNAAGGQTATSTSVTSSLNPSTVGASVTFTATVSARAAAARKAAVSAPPSGSVTFLDGATTLGTGTLSSGSATFATSALTPGSHSITAMYGGDPNYSTSTSSVVQQVVNAAPGSYTLSANPPSGSVSGSKTTAMITITVTPAGGFDSTVALSCSNLTPSLSCSFSPPSVTPNGAPATSALTITYQPAALAAPAQKSLAAWRLGSSNRAGTGMLGIRTRATLGLAFAVEMLLAALLLTRRKKLVSSLAGRLAYAVILFAFAWTALSGCAGGIPAPQTTSITVSATSGTQTVTLPVTVVVSN
jgi:hypothetical protein